MKYNLKEIVDIPKLQELTDELYVAASMPSSIITMDGEILTGSGWQRICTDFHRQHPQIEKECIESDTKIRKKLDQGEPFVIYKCPRGLVDASSPIIIAGEHVANVFSGQVLLAPPEKSTERFFREQSRKFGFDEESYIQAFRELPVFTEKKFRAALSFLAKLAQLIADMGHRRLSELEAVEALRTSEEQYRVLMDNAGEAIFIAQEGMLQYVNKKTEELSGYTQEELRSQPLSTFIYGEDRALVLNRHVKRRQGAEIPTRYSFRIVHKSGDVRWVEVNAVVVDWQGTVATLNFLRDITERKQAEEELRQSEEKFSTAFQTSPYAITITRAKDGAFIEVNDAFSSITGFTREEALADSSTGLNLWADEEDRTNVFFDLLEGKTVTGREFLFRKKHGEIITGLFSAEVISLNEEACILSSINDITERKRAEEEKARLEEQIHQTQKLESVGQLAGGVAHDLNNLLSPILGYGEMLRDDLGLDAARRESVDEILSAGLRARDLVRQLLAFSRRQTLEFNPLDMNEVVTGFENLLRRTLREDIGIEFVLSPDIQPVMADIGQIEQVIMNLAVNAADAMPDGGKLVIETTRMDLDDEYARTHRGAQPGRYVMLAVSDTGCGMEDENRERIFEPFFSTKGAQGTGLGLSTVYGIVKQHGGNVWVYSEPRKGTSFKIYLPVAEETQFKEKTGKKTAADLKGSENILLVEDNEHVRHLAHAILERQGYTVLVAEHGVEALRILASHDGPVHLLLTDVVMPGMNGRALFDKVAAMYPGLKVLYMSGYSTNIIAHRGVLDEGVQFIQKPFTVQGLATRVREVLERD